MQNKPKTCQAGGSPRAREEARRGEENDQHRDSRGPQAEPQDPDRKGGARQRQIRSGQHQVGQRRLLRFIVRVGAGDGRLYLRGIATCRARALLEPGRRSEREIPVVCLKLRPGVGHHVAGRAIQHGIPNFLREPGLAEPGWPVGGGQRLDVAIVPRLVEPFPQGQ